MTLAAAAASHPHPAREARADPRRRARRVLDPRFPRRHDRPDRRGRRHVEAEPALLFPPQGGDPPLAARAAARHLARPAARARRRGDPLTEIRAYIRRKLEMARDFPRESRLFANEILQGAPRIADAVEGALKATGRRQGEVIRGWMDAGRIVRSDPYHLIFSIWSTTQHYADFDVQVHAVLGGARRRRPVRGRRAVSRFAVHERAHAAPARWRVNLGRCSSARGRFFKTAPALLQSFDRAAMPRQPTLVWFSAPPGSPPGRPSLRRRVGWPNWLRSIRRRKTAAAFARYYHATHVPIAKTVPGRTPRKVPCRAGRAPRRVHLVAILHFDFGRRHPGGARQCPRARPRPPTC